MTGVERLGCAMLAAEGRGRDRPIVVFYATVAAISIAAT